MQSPSYFEASSSLKITLHGIRLAIPFLIHVFRVFTFRWLQTLLAVFVFRKTSTSNSMNKTIKISASLQMFREHPTSNKPYAKPPLSSKVLIFERKLATVFVLITKNNKKKHHIIEKSPQRSFTPGISKAPGSAAVGFCCSDCSGGIESHLLSSALGSTLAPALGAVGACWSFCLVGWKGMRRPRW